MVSHENLYTTDVIQTEKVIIRNIYVCTYTCMCVTPIRKKEAMSLKESNRSMWKFGERERKREMT